MNPHSLSHIEEPLPPKETLPTMYDLPYEDSEDIGSSTLFQAWQAQLLDETFCPPKLEPTEFFTASQLNVYYDVRQVFQYKQPDWFAVVGLPKSLPQPAQRMNYVTWEQGRSPLIVVELLTPGREGEVFGQPLHKANPLLTKWHVYERRMRVPYYVVFSPEENKLRCFSLLGTRYQEVNDHQGRFWIEDIELGLGLWQGRYGKENHLWLRWYDRAGNWVPALAERAQVERKEKEAAQQKVQQLAAKLRELGVDPDQL